MKTTIAIAALIVAVVPSAKSHAAVQPAGFVEPAPAIEAPWAPPPAAQPRWGATAVRLDLSTQLFGASLVGVEVSQRFGWLGGVDVAFGESDMGYGHTGLGADATGRLYLFDQASGGVSFGLGPSIRSANEFGTVGFMTGELAGEYRPRGGVSVLVGTGMSVALNDSGQAQCPTNGWLDCFIWTDHYSQGDKTLNFRLAVGGSF